MLRLVFFEVLLFLPESYHRDMHLFLLISVLNYNVLILFAGQAKETGYLKDHLIESVTENWCYFRFSPNVNSGLISLITSQLQSIFQLFSSYPPPPPPPHTHTHTPHTHTFVESSNATKNKKTCDKKTLINSAFLRFRWNFNMVKLDC